MNANYSKWGDVRAKGHAVDPRSPAEQAVGKAVARRSKFKDFSPNGPR
jgi:hypothetical protein